MSREHDRCPHCGTRSAEWDEQRGGDRDAYHSCERRCRGCELMESGRERLKSREDISTKGVYVTLRRREAGGP